jgi:hypothetical protein
MLDVVHWCLITRRFLIDSSLNTVFREDACCMLCWCCVTQSSKRNQVSESIGYLAALSFLQLCQMKKIVSMKDFLTGKGYRRSVGGSYPITISMSMCYFSQMYQKYETLIKCLFLFSKGHRKIFRVAVVIFLSSPR